jgi:hypothetical protein
MVKSICLYIPGNRFHKIPLKTKRGRVTGVGREPLSALHF